MSKPPLSLLLEPRGTTHRSAVLTRLALFRSLARSGAYHAGTPGEDVEESLLSGCALAIADVDDISLVTWDNLVVFSVQQECVWRVNTTFEIPAAMPACSGSHCICGWFWLANNGTGSTCSQPHCHSPLSESVLIGHVLTQTRT